MSISIPYLAFFALLAPISYLFALSVVKMAYRWPLACQVSELSDRLAESDRQVERHYLSVLFDEAKASLLTHDQNKDAQSKHIKTHGAGIYLVSSVLALTLGLNTQTIALISLVGMLWLMSAMDIAYRVVPENLVLLVASIGCLGLIFFDQSVLGFNSDVAAFSFACFAIVLGICVNCVNLWRFIKKQKDRLTIGSGDVLLSLALCFWFGFDVLVIVAIASFAMIVAQAWFSWRSYWPEYSRPHSAFIFPFVPGLLVGVLIVLIAPRPSWLELNRAASIIVKQFSLL